MVSADALLRREHPERGLVAPHEFIALAEDTGLIVPIGAWVLDQSCRQLARWQHIAPSMTVAVNLSVRQLLDPAIAARLSAVLLQSGARAKGLCLELTESVFMEDVEFFGKALAGLKRLGVRLTIDDFGTGYSSLNYAREFHVDILKIDKSFIDGVVTESPSSSLVATVLELARVLELKAVAEGVEGAEQLEHLKALNCDFGQGFLFARPLDDAGLRDVLRQRREAPMAGPVA
jgi:EAL domain-containing protein (putative c-di-GMP-specific phosphodiesterase class I)